MSRICYYINTKTSKFHVARIEIPWVEENTNIESGSGTPSINIINEAGLDLCHKESEKSRPTKKPTRKGINLT